MNYEQFKKLIENDYEEYTPTGIVDFSEPYGVPLGHLVFNDYKQAKYFKPKQKFPVVFKISSGIIFDVLENGDIVFHKDINLVSSHLSGKELKLLYQVLELSKKLREKQ